MALTSLFGAMSDPARKDTLADALAQGPLSLADALAYAVQLAAALRELHAADSAHGKVSPVSIVLKPSGVELLPSRLYFDEPERESDVRGWGAVLYEMLTGDKPQVDSPFGVPRLGGARSGPSAIRPAAQRLAMKCLVLPPHVLPTMQQALSEVRLLAVLARQYELRTEAAASQSMPTNTAPAPPFLMSPPASAVVPAPAPATPPAGQPLADARGSDQSRSQRAVALARLAESESPVAPPVTEPEHSDEPTSTSGYGLTSFGQPAPHKPAEPAGEGTGPCPRCDGSAVFVSKPRSGFENLLVRWGVAICRCHRCYHRWIVFARLKIGKSMPTGGGRRKKVKRRAKK